MCGIFGVSSTKNLVLKEKDFIKQCTFVGTLRGKDSTGLTLIDTDGDWETYKRALAGPDFAVSSTGQSAYNALNNACAVIGHNRAATRGVVANGTAHPFDFDRLVGCHNGTLHTNRGLTVTSMPVDSINLLATLNKEVKDADLNGYTDILKDLNGSYALNWYEYDTGFMYFVRNDQRPMHYFIEKEGETLFWSSEKEMLHWVLSRCSIKHDYDKLIELPEHTLCAFDANTGKIADMKKYEPETFQQNFYQGGYGAANKAGGGSKRSTGTTYDDKRDVRLDQYYGVNIEIVPISQAIKSKLWNDKDDKLAVIFDSVENTKSTTMTPKFMGTGVTQDGEAFTVVAWDAKDKIDLNVPYICEVVWIKYFEDRKGIVEMSIKAETAKAMATKKHERDNIIKEIRESIKLEHCPWVQICERCDEDKKPKDTKKVAQLEDKRKEKCATEFVVGPKGDFIPIATFIEWTEHGCHYCGCRLTPHDAPETSWEHRNGREVPVCDECTAEYLEHFEQLSMQ